MQKVLSQFLFWLSPAIAIGVAIYLQILLNDPSFTALTGIEREQRLLPLFYVAAGLGSLAVLGYLLSLSTRAKRRPWEAIFFSPFGAGFTAGITAYAFTFEEPNALMWLSGVGAGVAAAAIFVLFELFNRWLWQSMVNKFDEKNMGGAALVFSRLALLWRPGQDGLLLSVSMEMFRRGARGDHAENLRRAHAAGNRSPDLLELLCQLASEEQKPTEYLGYLRDLFLEFPDDDQLRAAYLEELLEQKRNAEALALMEKFGVEDEELALERYGTLLVEAGRHDAALDAAARLGNIEGIPMRRADAIVRAILSRNENHLAAINLTADWAERMARRDQQIRWLEKSVNLDPTQRQRAAKLADLLEDAGMGHKLETQLAAMREHRPNDENLGLRHARVLHANGKPAQAAKVLEHFRERGCDDPELYEILAQSYFEMEKLDEARATILAAQKAVRDEEMISRMNTLKKKVERAAFTAELAQLLEEAEAKPEDLDLQLRALERLANPGHAERAVALADNALKHHPSARPAVIEIIHTAVTGMKEGGFQLLNYLADLQVAEGNYDDALETVKLMAHRSLNPASAIRDGAQKILRRSPHHLNTLRSMGEMYQDLGQFTEMIHAYSLYLANGGEESEAMDLSLANAYMSLNDYPSARRFVNSLLKSAQTEEARERNVELLRRVIPMAIATAHATDAAEYQKTLEALTPDDKATIKLRRDVDRAVGRERFAFLKREVDSGNSDAAVLEELGDLSMDDDEVNEAITYYQRAARQPDATSLPKAKLAYAFAVKRMFDLAGETLAEISLSLDDDPQLLEQMMDWMYRTGEVLENAHMFERASRLFKHLMKIDAGYKDVIQRVERLGRK